MVAERLSSFEAESTQSLDLASRVASSPPRISYGAGPLDEHDGLWFGRRWVNDRRKWVVREIELGLQLHRLGVLAVIEKTPPYVLQSP